MVDLTIIYMIRMFLVVYHKKRMFLVVIYIYMCVCVICGTLYDDINRGNKYK